MFLFHKHEVNKHGLSMAKLEFEKKLDLRKIKQCKARLLKENKHVLPKFFPKKRQNLSSKA